METPNYKIAIDDDRPNPTAPLLSPSSTTTTTTSTSTSTTVLFSVIITTCIFFAYLSFSTPHYSNPTHISTTHLACPLHKLTHPVVILISTDGFRFGYQFKTPTPNMDRLIEHGTEAETGLIPIFPTLTFPNHYSIVTGLYPYHHGIVANSFRDPAYNDSFNMGSLDPKWWLGEPLWETVVNHGLKAATYFWPGSAVRKGSWTCPDKFCFNYNGSVPFEERVDTVLNYFDLPSDEIPSFMTLYLEDPDHQGHQGGPDDPSVAEAVGRIDEMIGLLIQGLEKRGVFNDVNIILVGDHGMVGICDQKRIFLNDLSSWINVTKDWVQSQAAVLSIRPPSDVSPADVVAKMNEGLKSGKVKNGDKLEVYLKDELPSRLHYSGSDRIPPIIGLVAEGFRVQQKESSNKECGGTHGYDNAYFSMRTIFIGHGPHFAKGRKVPSFENVEIYNMVTSILNITGSSNDGTASFPDKILLPCH